MSSSENSEKVIAEKNKRDEQDVGHKSTLRYYRRNRSELLGDIAFNFNKQKAPAATGLIVLLPLTVVGLIIAWLFSKISLIPYNELLNLTNFYIIDQSIKLATLIILGTLLVTATGKIVRNPEGYAFERTLDNVIGRIPFLGAIYRITKVTTETIIEGTEELRSPVRIEFGEMKITGFKTGNKTEEGRHLIFVPTSPNITTGLLLEIKPEQITETNETPEEALTRVLSAGFGQNNSKEKQEQT